MKNVLITGANGQLGKALHRLNDQNTLFRFYYTDIDTLNICDKKVVRQFMKGNGINYVINCAAYTAVDMAEEEEPKAFAINCMAVQNLAEVAYETDAKIIHVSTDYVYNGDTPRPYKEEDRTDPKSAYGRTKLAGEQVLRRVCKESVIIRTSWLYSTEGNNFVNTMLRLGKEKKELNVVFDQIGTPTYAGDLASTILTILDKAEEGEFHPGIYNYSNEGVCSWYDFAVKIMELGGLNCKINPIETVDYPTPAIRPAYSVLNKSKIKEIYNVVIPHWEESLKKVIKR